MYLEYGLACLKILGLIVLPVFILYLGVYIINKVCYNISKITGGRK